MKYKALLLDFDNTIIGTEDSNHLLFLQTIEGLIGRRLTREDGRNFTGHTWKGIFQIMSDKYLPEIKPEELRGMFISAKRDYFKDKTAPIANGLSELLALDIKKAIVTGSCRAEVDMFAHMFDLDRFDVVATDELYDKGKPAPDGYVYAAGELGLEPFQCLAVEDSHIGLTSARTAGCATVFTREFADDDHSSIADYTVKTMADVIKILKSPSVPL